MSDESSSNNAGCGCVPFIILVLSLWALWVGLPTPWGVFHIDLIPPAIRIEAPAIEQPDELEELEELGL